MVFFGILFSIPLTTFSADTTPPSSPVKLVFIHHSTGGNWLADANHEGPYGGLGQALMDNNYYVSATNYGWGYEGIGDRTDIPNWMEWFTGTNSHGILDQLYHETGQNVQDFGDWSRMSTDPGGENTIVLFKSCFPNSDLFGDPTDPPAFEANEYEYTVSNAKAVFNEILTYFQTRQDKLFIVITSPPQLRSDYCSDYQTPEERAANARAFTTWLVNEWLESYPYKNVAVFDYFNVLTGADNHHRYINGSIEHVTLGNNNFAILTADEYDSHPSTQGHQKATQEFVPLLNYYYNQWKGTSSPEWVQISGSVQYGGEAVCAMILANGQFMFTCDQSLGMYNLTVPTDSKGQITLYCFCDGLAPFKEVLTPSQAVDYDLHMSEAPPESQEINLTYQLGVASAPDRVLISGKAALDETPLNIMVLANGEQMFTPQDSGAYSLEVPLDESGQITLFGFCEGFQPYKRIIGPW